VPILGIPEEHLSFTLWCVFDNVRKYKFLGHLEKVKINSDEKLLAVFTKSLNAVSDWAEIFQPITKFLNITIGDSLQLTVTKQNAEKKCGDVLIGGAFTTFLEKTDGRGKPAKAENVYLVQLAHKKNGTDTLDSNGTSVLGLNYFLY
jgi:hypothetical protein